MNSLRRIKRRLTWLAAAAAGVAVLLPVQASATPLSDQMAVSFGSPIRLVNGVYLVVPVNVTCPASLASDVVVTESVDASVTQKSGRDLANGEGGFFYQSGAFGGLQLGTPLVCDGTAHAYAVNVQPADGSVPFHGGRAVATSSVTITVIDPSTGTWNTGYLSSGPQGISVKGG